MKILVTGFTPFGTYFSNLLVKAMVEHMKNNNIPAYISYSAGTYVCNDVFYHLMYLIHSAFPAIRGRFIHVPFELSQVVTMPNATLHPPCQSKR